LNVDVAVFCENYLFLGLPLLDVDFVVAVVVLYLLALLVNCWMQESKNRLR
jgi:hypothetical protein